MELYYPTLILLTGFIFDLILGDPPYRLHPVRIVGNGISFFLNIVSKLKLNPRVGGTCITLIILICSTLFYSIIYKVLYIIHPILSLFFNLYVFYSIIAVKDLIKHCRPVYNALSDGNLESARIAVGMIVGRDTNNLDEKGVARATIETLAENFVDGFLSPVFWYGAGCLIGRYINIDPGYTGILFMLFFKVVSTLDSMVGYKTTELKEIGWSGARLDDLMNFIPARLSLLFLAGGAVLSGLNPIGGIKTSIRDRLKHESPNSAHPESFVAGAIKARLGGPAIYSEGIRDKPWLGEEYPDPSFKNIKHVIRLVSRSSCLTILAFLLILIIGG